MDKYILALDQGTTSSRAILFKNGKAISSAQNELSQIYPQAGYAEHDPKEIWETQIRAARDAVSAAKIPASAISAVGITNQRETTLLWDKKTGKPVHNAIVWQCRRTAGICERLAGEGLTGIIAERTGLVTDAYFSATKIMWLLENIPGLRKRAVDGEIAFGTPDTWLVWNLTGGKEHVTDYTNASRTMLFNINTLDWDDELLRMFGIPRQILPRVVRSSGVIGETVPELFGTPVPIAGIAGDQQAALFGQRCFLPGDAKNTYGTGCFLLMNTGETPVRSQYGLLTTVAATADGSRRFALEGSIFSGGSVVQWLRDELRLISSAAETEALASEVDSNAGVYIVPAFVGLGAPYWNAEARGTIVGLTRGANRAHLARAALESMAFQSLDVLAAMERDSGTGLSSLKVDGGASANGFLMQFQSDILEKPVVRPQNTESTATGAAFLAGIGAGLWRIDDLPAAGGVMEFRPAMESAAREKLLGEWKNAAETALFWAKDSR